MKARYYDANGHVRVNGNKKRKRWDGRDKDKDACRTLPSAHPQPQHDSLPKSTHFILAVKKAYFKEIQSIEIRTEGNNDG